MNGKTGVDVTAGRTLSHSIERAQLAERLGFDSIWTVQLPDARDATQVLAAYAHSTQRIGLGTFVLPIYTRHPTAAAQAALTLDEISGGRFRLGLGVSHRVTVESMWGLKLEHPAAAMREYLGIVRSIVTTGAASFDGRHFSAHMRYSAPRREDLPILISALSPLMLELAGEIADGVALWMCAPKYIRDEVVPRVRAGRERAGKPLAGFEIAAAVPISLTADPAAGRDAFRVTATRYASLPFYRAALDRTFGDLMADKPPDEVLEALAGIGDEAAVRGAIDRYREAGTTLPILGLVASHAGAAGFEQTIKAAAA